jgi:hypothetical protein
VQCGDSFFNGDTSVNAKAFDGLTKTLTGTAQEVSMGTNGGNLTLDAVDQAIDLIAAGRPDALLMSKRTRRKLSSLRRSSGIMLETTVDAFGRHVVMYDGIPVLVDDNVSDAQTQGTSNTCSSIYAVRWGMEGVMGLQNSEIQVTEVGDLETKDAGRFRIKWYASVAVFSMLGVSRVKGILP